MQILTWPHKRHRLLTALAALDPHVAARAHVLEEHWADLPALVDAVSAAPTPDAAAAAGAAKPTDAARLSPALARAAATVAVAREASLAPAKPMKGEPVPETAKASPTGTNGTLSTPVPFYLQ